MGNWNHNNWLIEVEGSDNITDKRFVDFVNKKYFNEYEYYDFKASLKNPKPYHPKAERLIRFFIEYQKIDLFPDRVWDWDNVSPKTKFSLDIIDDILTIFSSPGGSFEIKKLRRFDARIENLYIGPSFPPYQYKRELPRMNQGHINGVSDNKGYRVTFYFDKKKIKDMNILIELVKDYCDYIGAERGRILDQESLEPVLEYYTDKKNDVPIKILRNRELYIKAKFKIKSKDRIQKDLDIIAEEFEAIVKHSPNSSVVSLCANYSLCFKYEETISSFKKVKTVEMFTSNMFCGPGYHHTVIMFLEKLSAINTYEIQIFDETGYYANRNYDNLVNTYKEWLYNLLKDAYNNIYDQSAATIMGWDSNEYIPSIFAGTVLTPMGRFTSDTLSRLLSSNDTTEICNTFFIWNHIEKDAIFYRNYAIHLLWKYCYYNSSKRSEADAVINGCILSNIERAASMSEDIPLPINEYKELCEINNIKSQNFDKHEHMQFDFPVGYRKEWIKEKINNIRISIPGYMLYGIDNNAIVFHNELNAVRIRNFNVSVKEYYYKENIMHIVDARNLGNGAKAKLFRICTNKGNQKEPYQCQVILPKEFYLITLASKLRYGKDRKLAIKIYESITLE